MKLKFWEKCFYCKGTSNIKKMQFGCMRVTYHHYYHDDCLKEVICNPKKHSNSNVEIAIQIMEEAKEKEKHRNNLIKRAKHLCHN